VGANCVSSGSTYSCEQSFDYEVKLVSAVVASQKPDGTVWDGPQDSGCLDCLIGCCPPDVYPASGSAIAGLSISKDTKDDTVNPTWNQVLGTVSDTQLNGASVNITLMDDDTISAHDMLGSCTWTVSPAAIQALQLVLDKSHGCSGSVEQVVFSLTKITP
jgi:hypothetical protein